MARRAVRKLDAGKRVKARARDAKTGRFVAAFDPGSERGVAVKPPRTKAEASAQIRRLVRANKRALDALSKL